MTQQPTLDLRFTFGAMRQFQERTKLEFMSIFPSESPDAGREMMNRFLNEPGLIEEIVFCGQKHDVEMEDVKELVDTSTINELVSAITGGIKGEADPEPDEPADTAA